jgi:hypothetical protein
MNMRARVVLVLVVLAIVVLAPAAFVPSPRVAASSQASIGLTLGTPRQLFHRNQPDSLGLFNVPDMHTAVLQVPDKSYLVWIAGVIGRGGEGSTARLSTKDFLTYKNAGPGSATRAQPVFRPSCRGETDAPDCRQNHDASYAGANAVITAANGKDLLMLYEAGNTRTLAPSGAERGGGEYNVMALARSTDKGLTWTRQGAVVSGPDPMPTAPTGVMQPGISEAGVIVANGFLYMFFQYVPNEASEPDAPSVIQMARAPVASDGAPSAWTKYDNGSFGVQPGLGGHGSTIVATGPGSGCTRPVQVWAAFNTYLNAYVLTFLCNEGWFFSTSTDLVTWAAPTQFLKMLMFRTCEPMDENYILVTPGNPGGVIGQTGYVLYSHTSARGVRCPTLDPHELWMRPFTFTKSP